VTTVRCKILMLIRFLALVSIFLNDIIPECADF